MNLWLFMVPACLHCKHYQSYAKGRHYDDLAKCTRNATLYAEMVRADNTKCGMKGVWFESK